MKRKTKQVIKISLLSIYSFLFLANNSNAQCNVTSSSWCLQGNSGLTTPLAPSTYGTSLIGASENWMGTADANDIVFGTNNIERMRMKQNTGYVGIGLSSPAYKLDVVGDINLTGALRMGGAAGTVGMVLTSAGGLLNTWTIPTTGTITSIITNNGITGGPINLSGTIGLTGQALALHNLATNGLIARTGSGTVASRTLTGTARITITNGDGVAGDPTIDIAQNAATTGQVLKWNGTNWAPAADDNSGGTTFGSGTFNYLARWTSTNTLGIGATYDDGTNVGIGTTNPQANLEIKNGTVLFDGTIDNTPLLVNGAGTRMMWIPSKAAFRAGAVTSNYWDATNIGTHSTAFGYNTQASGDYSTALGYGSWAQSYSSFVVGRYNVISGTQSNWVLKEPLFVIGNGDSHFRSNAMTVLKNGNVGIATANPLNKLDVQGGVSIGQGYAGYKVAPFNGAIIKGNVGIGTPIPIQTLDVNGRINVTNGVIQKGGVAITNTSDMGLYSLDPNTWMRFVTNGQPIRFYSDGGTGTTANMIIAANGEVGIGTDLASNSAHYKLAVNGAVRAKRFVVETTWQDFVFDKKYKLKSLQEVEQYIKQNGHLPEIPSAKEVENNGGDLGELVSLQMKKIEELTLYVIEQNKKIEELSKQVKSLKR